MPNSGRVDLAKIGAIVSTAMAILALVFSLGIAFGKLGGIEKNEQRIVASERHITVVAADLREIKAILQILLNDREGTRKEL